MSSSNKKKSNHKKKSAVVVPSTAVETTPTINGDGVEVLVPVVSSSGTENAVTTAVVPTTTGMGVTSSAPATIATTTVTATELEHLLRQQMMISSSSNSIHQQHHQQQQQLQQRHHAFWDTQPMSHANAVTSSTTAAAASSSSSSEEVVVHCEEGPIIPNRDVSEIRPEPYSMPSGFHWSNVNMSDPVQALELYNLLSQNYVEDDDELFRFDYSIDFLSWALQPPEFDPNFIFGVRTDGTHPKLVAFISGVPTTIQIHDHTVRVVEINFLCVHKKLRSKRLAPVLIKEITRRVNLTGIFQAVYTAGTVLPVPISSARYYHRNLNPKKLVDVGFSRIGHRMTMARMVKLYKVSETPSNMGLRPMIEKDVPSVHVLLNQYLSKFSLKILFSLDEIRHWLLPRDNVINTYVICNSDHVVTDMISFYHLPSNILRHTETKLYAAYSFYNVATTVPYTQLMKDALILAKHTCNSDVYNALNLMDNNDEIFKELKFGIGDGTLQYYIYNWALATNQTITSNQLGIVLL